MSKVRLFTSPGCVNCPTMIAIVKHIAGKDNFDIIDVTSSPEALASLVHPVDNTPIKQVPTVIIGDNVYNMRNVRDMELKLEELYK